MEQHNNTLKKGRKRFTPVAMAKSILSPVLLFLYSSILSSRNGAAAFSICMNGDSRNSIANNQPCCRRSFFSTSFASVAGASIGLTAQRRPSYAATAKEIITTPSGIKYAVLKEPSEKKTIVPLKGDIVAIEYTGYLVNGQVSDDTNNDPQLKFYFSALRAIAFLYTSFIAWNDESYRFYQ